MRQLGKQTPSPGGTERRLRREYEPLLEEINSTGRLLGVGRNSVYNLIKAGRLEAVKIGSRTLITRASINRLASPSRDA